MPKRESPPHEHTAGDAVDQELAELLERAEHQASRAEVGRIEEREHDLLRNFSNQLEPLPRWMNDAVIEVIRDRGCDVRFVPTMVLVDELTESEEHLRFALGDTSRNQGWHVVPDQPISEFDLSLLADDHTTAPKVMHSEDGELSAYQPRTVAEWIGHLQSLEQFVPDFQHRCGVRMVTGAEFFHLTRDNQRFSEERVSGDVLVVNVLNRNTVPTVLSLERSEFTSFYQCSYTDEFHGLVYPVRKLV